MATPETKKSRHPEGFNNCPQGGAVGRLRFIHASIDMQEQVLPMVAPGAANTQMIGG